jgi:hypothetical protein
MSARIGKKRETLTRESKTRCNFSTVSFEINKKFFHTRTTINNNDLWFHAHISSQQEGIPALHWVNFPFVCCSGKSRKKSETLNDCYYVINLDLLQMMILFASEASTRIGQKNEKSFVDLHDIEKNLEFPIKWARSSTNWHCMQSKLPTLRISNESNWNFFLRLLRKLACLHNFFWDLLAHDRQPAEMLLCQHLNLVLNFFSNPRLDNSSKELQTRSSHVQMRLNLIRINSQTIITS